MIKQGILIFLLISLAIYGLRQVILLNSSDLAKKYNGLTVFTSKKSSSEKIELRNFTKRIIVACLITFFLMSLVVLLL